MTKVKIFLLTYVQFQNKDRVLEDIFHFISLSETKEEAIQDIIQQVNDFHGEGEILYKISSLEELNTMPDVEIQLEEITSYQRPNTISRYVIHSLTN